MAHQNGGQGPFFSPRHQFHEVFNYVGKDGVEFKSTTGETIFARWGKTKEGNHDTIIFLGERNRHGSACEACWGYRTDCNGSWIGQCAQALDEAI